MHVDILSFTEELSPVRFNACAGIPIRPFPGLS